jgi:hypothetical protein
MTVPLYVDNKITFRNNFSIDIKPYEVYTSLKDCEGYYGLFGKPFHRVFKFREDEEKYYYSVIISLWRIFEIIEHIVIPDEVVRDIDNNNAKILLVCPYEGFSWEIWETAVRKIQKKYSWSDDRFVVLDANLKSHPTIKSVYFNFWERGSLYSDLPAKLVYGIDRIVVNSSRSKKFIYLNRRPHAGRLAAVTLMEKYKDIGYLSLGLNGQMHPGYYESQETIFKELYPEIYKIYQKSNLKSKLPFTIDDGIDAEQDNPVDDTKIDKFYNSYLHIVAETYQTDDPDRLFFSEKIFKPIKFMQPFIILGQKHSLEYLKKLGYKTFSNFFDEEYDNIDDNQKRLNHAINVATNIINKTDSDLEKLMKDCLPILTHNISHLQYRCMTYDMEVRSQLLDILYE